MFKFFDNLIPDNTHDDLKSDYCAKLNKLISKDFRELRIDSSVLKEKLTLLRRSDIPEFEFEDEFCYLLPMLEETISVYERSPHNQDTAVKCHRNIRLILSQMKQLNEQLIEHYDSSQLDTIYEIVKERNEPVSIDDFFRRDEVEEESFEDDVIYVGPTATPKDETGYTPVNNDLKSSVTEGVLREHEHEDDKFEEDFN